MVLIIGVVSISISISQGLVGAVVAIHPWDEEQWLPGVLSKRQLCKLINADYIELPNRRITEEDKSLDHSSIDLHLSGEGYHLIHGSIKPHGENYGIYFDNPTYAEKIDSRSDGTFELRANQCYVFKLRERFAPRFGASNIFGQATAKSSVGRLDVIARLVVDGMDRYEYMDPKLLNTASGKMYLEIIPISFNINVKSGTSLSQLRLFNGRPSNSMITDTNFIKNILKGSENGEGYLSVDITPTEIGKNNVTAFRAIDTLGDDVFIDAWTKTDRSEQPQPTAFWQFVNSENDGRLKIERNKFYILRSKERICLPAGVAVYAKAMDETLGEMRIHYAGFAHPFFGKERKDGKDGTPLIFEVRGHSVDVSLADGETLARLVFYRMSEEAKKDPDDEKKQKESCGGSTEPIEDSYGNQELKLSKYFRAWPKNVTVDSCGNVTDNDLNGNEMVQDEG